MAAAELMEQAANTILDATNNFMTTSLGLVNRDLDTAGVGGITGQQFVGLSDQQTANIARLTSDIERAQARIVELNGMNSSEEREQLTIIQERQRIIQSIIDTTRGFANILAQAGLTARQIQFADQQGQLENILGLVGEIELIEQVLANTANLTVDEFIGWSEQLVNVQMALANITDGLVETASLSERIAEAGLTDVAANITTRSLERGLGLQQQINALLTERNMLGDNEIDRFREITDQVRELREQLEDIQDIDIACLLYTSPSPRD